MLNVYRADAANSSARYCFHTAAYVCVPWPWVSGLSGTTTARPRATPRDTGDLALENAELDVISSGQIHPARCRAREEVEQHHLDAGEVLN